MWLLFIIPSPAKQGRMGGVNPDTGKIKGTPPQPSPAKQGRENAGFTVFGK
jgi:hypothetical protein